SHRYSYASRIEGNDRSTRRAGKRIAPSFMVTTYVESSRLTTPRIKRPSVRRRNCSAGSGARFAGESAGAGGSGPAPTPTASPKTVRTESPVDTNALVMVAMYPGAPEPPPGIEVTGQESRSGFSLTFLVSRQAEA